MALADVITGLYPMLFGVETETRGNQAARPAAIIGLFVMPIRLVLAVYLPHKIAVADRPCYSHSLGWYLYERLTGIRAVSSVG